MNAREQMEKAAVVRRLDSVAAAERYKDDSKRRLLRILTTKHKTTLIGALARFEEYFGELWGHGLPANELTAEQLDRLDAWKACRTEVLNNGNAQLRALEKELVLYSVEWLRYRQVLPVRSPGEDGPK